MADEITPTVEVKPTSLQDILNDPNYVNANDITKKAIFDKYSATDPNFTNANEVTQNAIRQRFGVIGAPPQTQEQIFKPEDFQGIAPAPGDTSIADTLRKYIAEPAAKIGRAHV